jgi:hypothetical protein
MTGVPEESLDRPEVAMLLKKLVAGALPFDRQAARAVS